MKWTALLIGRGHGLAWPLLPLLHQAGFSVDVITSSPLMRHCPRVRKCTVVPYWQPLIPVLSQENRREYDWKIITEDDTLQEILTSSLSQEEKLSLLPVVQPQSFSHLYSKIGLSKLLSSAGIRTPPFSIAHSKQEALEQAKEIGYPVFIKQDASSAGVGVFECRGNDDLVRLPSKIFQMPVLVQKKIFGREYDLSGIYLEKELVHFSCSRVEKVAGSQFGPSSVRTYFPLSTLEKSVFQELELLGKVLGAHGFTNTSCMQQADGKRFYFEVDMRPNVWIHSPTFLGEDPSFRIQQWFLHKRKLCFPVPASSKRAQPHLIPYFLRLRAWELFLNRYQVWKYLPKNHPEWVWRLLWDRFVVHIITEKLFPLIKKILPVQTHPVLSYLRRSSVLFLERTRRYLNS